MTIKHYSAPEGLCTYPGCTDSRYVSPKGKRYTRCYAHVRERNKRESDKKKLIGLASSAHVPESTPSRHVSTPPPQTVRVMVLDWESQRLFHVTGVVESTKNFPATDGDLKKTIAQASQQGIYVAYIRAYKEEDLYEST